MDSSIDNINCCELIPCSTHVSILARERAVASLASLDISCSFSIMTVISPVEACVRPARVRTSSATTAKPRPDSPARAASIAAFNANKLVCSAISRITSTTTLICLDCSSNSETESPAKPTRLATS